MIPGWKTEIENEYLQLLQDSPHVSPADLAARLGESECCVVYWLTQLAKEGRVRIVAVELVKEHEVPCAPQSFLNCERKASCPITEVAAAWRQPLESA